MELPPEILDKILEHIPTDSEGQQTLIACALVATLWTGPSQRRLFSSVAISDGNHQRWMNSVVHPRPKIHLLQHVRSLHHHPGENNIGVRYSIRNLPTDSGEYLSTLCGLRSLTLINHKIEPISEEGFHTCFLAFRETLTDLNLWIFSTSFSMFVILVDYFPNITTLQLGPKFSLKLDEGPTPPLSRPLRGKITIRDTNPSCLEFFNRLAKLDLEYEGLAIEYCVGMETKFLESLLQISASTVKYLRLPFILQREHPYRTSPSLRVLTQA